MRHHDPISPCATRGLRRPGFRARGCRRPPRHRACCQVLHLAGELDLAATPVLLLAVGRTLDLPQGREGSPGLVLDLRALTFCDAAGLTGLLRAGRLADGVGVTLSVTAPPRRIVRILDICGLHHRFALHPTT